jgi:hypothetical protein
MNSNFYDEDFLKPSPVITGKDAERFFENLNTKLDKKTKLLKIQELKAAAKFFKKKY